MPKVISNGIAIEYDSFGKRGAPVILLIAGLRTQMIRWDAGFCRMLAEQGYHIIRFDNRDSGLSSQVDGPPAQDLAAIAQAAATGEPPATPYTLADMAQDAVGLLDALQIESAHVVGRSMGGMIAQLLASAFPRRVLSLAILMSSSGNRRLPGPSPAIMAALMARPPDPFQDRDAYLDHCVAFARLSAGRGYPFDAAAHRQQAAAELARAYTPGGVGRQLGAIAATSDLRERLAAIRVPTLVIHGADDPLVPPACGRDVAEHIRNARLLIVEGMGHAVPPELFAQFADAIAANAASGRVGGLERVKGIEPSS